MKTKKDELWVTKRELRRGYAVLEIDFFNGFMQRTDEPRKLQAFKGPQQSMSRFKPEGQELKA